MELKCDDATCAAVLHIFIQSDTHHPPVDEVNKAEAAGDNAHFIPAVSVNRLLELRRVTDAANHFDLGFLRLLWVVSHDDSLSPLPHEHSSLFIEKHTGKAIDVTSQ